MILTLCGRIPATGSCLPRCCRGYAPGRTVWRGDDDDDFNILVVSNDDPSTAGDPF
jgi:hypothetical protein